MNIDKKTSLNKNVISFILIICLIFPIPMFTGMDKTYATTEEGITGGESVTKLTSGAFDEEVQLEEEQKEAKQKKERTKQNIVVKADVVQGDIELNVSYSSITVKAISTTLMAISGAGINGTPISSKASIEDTNLVMSGKSESYNVTVDGNNGIATTSFSITLDNLNITSGTTSPFRIINKADVTMNLEDSNNLISTKLESAALNVPIGNSITILGSGELTAKATHSNAWGAGIGGSYGQSASDITISGDVTIDATSNKDGAGIGGGQTGDGSDITIIGSAKVNASSNHMGAGIGGAGRGGVGSDITISGNADVNASSDLGAGIGGGDVSIGRDITINGSAKVNASSSIGAGIGGGCARNGSNITISGGFVTAKSENGHDIGSGDNGGKANNIVINGGSVFAFKGKIGTTPQAVSGGEYVYKVTVPAVYTGTNKSLRGNLDIAVSQGGANIYKAKTISDDSFEHGSDFPTNEAVAYIYLPQGNYDDITVASCTGSAFADVRPAPTELTDNFVLWDNPIPVYFSAEGASEVSPTTKGVSYGSTYGALAEITRAGYKFDGWYPTGSGVSEILPTTIVDNMRPHTLYASCTPKEYEVIFSAQGGVIDGWDFREVIFDDRYDAIRTLPTAWKIGYVFDGWYTSTGGTNLITDGSIVKIDSNHYLYAHWSGKQYDVTYVSSGATEISFDKKSLTYGTVYGDMPATTKTGYTLDRWQTYHPKEITSGSIVEIASNHDITAVWKVNKYILSFDKNTGDTVSKPTMSAVYDSPYGNLPTATKKGYTFGGWYTAKSGGTKIESTDIVKITKDTTLYAAWTPNTYTLSYDRNGGDSQSFNSKSVTYDEKYGDHPTTTKKDYTFGGWYTAKSGGTKIESTDIVKITKDTTLYAHWKVNKYKVTFKANAKKVKNLKPKSKKVAYGTKYGKLPKPNKVGYKFKGWYTKKAGGKKITSKTKMIYKKNIKLYAHWSKNAKIVKCKKVHIRKGPGRSFDVKAYAKRNQKVSVIKKVKNGAGHTWYKVKVGNKKGYIYGKYVKWV